MDYDLHLGDMREVLRTFEAESIDSIVSDPPYGLSFMGKGWDKGVPGDEFWKEALRVAKPGAHLLAFGGTRTYHRLMCAIEDAGWEIRDCIMWVYGSGFPKSHDVSKAIDREAGAEREVVGLSNRHGGGAKVFENQGGVGFETNGKPYITAPATEAAKQWHGWGTALKPAWEPIIVARKPLEGTVAQNVLKHGTGGMNIEACRVEGVIEHRAGGLHRGSGNTVGSFSGTTEFEKEPHGRWPANLIHDGSDEVVGLFPADAGGGFGVRGAHSSEHLKGKKATYEQVGFGDSGSAARFFYCAKTSKRDRNEGCEGLPIGSPVESGRSTPAEGRKSAVGAPRSNHHPTVKPTDLMRYCVKLVTPPGGVVLDPFMGSGSTGKAAMLEGMNFIGVDLDPEYLRIADSRISHALKNRESKC